MSLAAYQGDLLWSILGCIHGLAKSNYTLPSYSEMVEKAYSLKASGRTQLNNTHVVEAVDGMLDAFLPSDRTGKEGASEAI